MEVQPSPVPGASPATGGSAFPTGAFVELDGQTYYRIAAFDQLDPFLMALPGDTDLWMFIASGGGLTAGRVDANGSLFPYVTVDQLHDAHHHTGPLTLIRVERRSGESVGWEPFAPQSVQDPPLERNLYKNAVGNRLVFEEIHHELGLAFRYRWSASDEFGWVRTSTLHNRGKLEVRICVLDGLRNVLPFGAPLSLYQQVSNLVDAYKKSEVDPETGLGIFSLTASITDRAEALEVLKANTVWCCGLERFQMHLSLAAVKAFRSGQRIAQEHVLNGVRGNYLVSSRIDLKPGESSRWHLVADTGQDHVRIAGLRRRLRDERDLMRQIEESLRRAEENLLRNVSSADGLELSGHPESRWHRFANVLFNNMRGGVFLSNYTIPVADLADSLRVRNRLVADRHRARLADLGAASTLQEIRAAAAGTGDADFERLIHEYLPLYFGRRHGDPSRPWNRFSIRARNRDGERELNYEGNWRDIFQNWEALGTAFPGFLPSMVAKFVNASTADGFNPYRITRDGVDWETASPEDRWSNIGYWGDHQIVYLLRLLEALDGHDPQAIGEMLGREIFAYVEVPYRIRPYEKLLADPRQTIDYDHDLAARIVRRVERMGSDGKLLTDPDGSIYHANLLEKLLVPALSKLSNLVLDAGIWMNTQRPEWNDANNALAGGGVSVVTLCHLRRYLAFLADRLPSAGDASLPVSREIVDWFGRIETTLRERRELLTADSLGSRDRKRWMDDLGGAFSQYREIVYSSGFSGKTHVGVRRVVDLCRAALEFIDWGIAANRRPDGLFHTYNVLQVAEDGNGIEAIHLQEMLEGQVAVLSSGFLTSEEALDVVRQLFRSALYQPNQRSFMLYPEKSLPGFLAKNRIPEPRVAGIGLLNELLAAENRSVLTRDVEGVCRFHGDLRSAGDLGRVLDDLAEEETWRDAVARDRVAILDLFEDVFGHDRYTGRSGVMYAYEGIGCIYWHMVAKLLLAVQEHVLAAHRDRRPAAIREDLVAMYLRIRAGLGYEKSVAEFGAFPTDPYSHTPPGGGAKQPGMTGQVKEEILTRRGELGIHVADARVSFRPVLLRASEFVERPESFRYFDLDGQTRSIALSPQSLAFTLYQVPVVYECVKGDSWIHVAFRDGSTAELAGNSLDVPLSADLFSRSGRIDRIRVGIPDQELCQL